MFLVGYMCIIINMDCSPGQARSNHGKRARDCRVRLTVQLIPENFGAREVDL